MEINFKKYKDGLAPAIIQDANTRVVLMLGFMDEKALLKTMETRRVTFFSRSKGRLWTKGETSGNFIEVKEILHDCDNDTLLIKGIPVGPVCHTGSDTCFNEKNESSFLFKLQEVIADRKSSLAEGSYTASLFKKGIPKIAQKVGEEAVELVIEAMRNETGLFKNEAADLLFHYLILLQAKGMQLETIITTLEERHHA